MSIEPPPDTYGNAWARVYDQVHAGFDPTAAVDALAKLARGGRVLELGVGTGRVALPLAARGIDVHGIDASAAMLDVLRSKPGAERVSLTCGDFTTVPVDGEFSLIYIAFNTLFALLTPDAQVSCMTHVARHLTRDGLFVVEAFVPDPSRFDRGQRVHVDHIGPGRVHLSVSQYDAATQRVRGQQIAIGLGAIELRPIDLRLAWPSEIDLMAQLAGLRRRTRWGNWEESPFTAGSGKHISLYERGT